MNNKNTENNKKTLSDVKNKLLHSKKFKYGTSAVVFSVVFVAVVLLINVVISLVSSRTGGLYVDMTTSNIYEASEATVKAVSGLVHEVTVTFASPKDVVESNEEFNSVRLLCEDLAKKSGKVKIEYKDSDIDNSYFIDFKKANSKDVTRNSIVVHCKQTGYSRVFEDYYEMYKISSSSGRIFAFNGENKLVTAMLAVAGGDIYKVGFVTGHDESESEVLEAFFGDNGYLVEKINLKKKEDNELKSYKTLVICNPKRDFEGRSASAKNSDSEIEKLRRYVNDFSGNVILFVSPEGYNMPELFGLFADNFGVSIDNNSIVTAGNENMSSIPRYFYSNYQTDTESVGYEIHKSVSEGSSAFGPLFGWSCALDITKKSDTGFYRVSPVLLTGDDGIKYVTADQNLTSVPYTDKPLLTVTECTKISNDKENRSYVFTVASSEFIDGLEYTSQTNADLMRSIFVKTGNENIVTDIDFKVVDDPTIQVSEKQIKKTQQKLVFVIPIIIAVAGLAVYIRRKRL